ncbi:MAG: zinc-dependent alcohol dehydrogenase family protein [Planctomycetota bacterium]
MNAVVFERTGEPGDVLSVRAIDPPKPDSGEVLVRMLASPVNPSDLMFVRGQYTLQPTLPATPGFEGVGVVEQASGGLRSRFMLGKKVCVMSRRGGNWAEYNAVPATQVIPFSPLLTGEMSIEQGATFFVNPATAFVMTRKVLNVPAGQWLLQTASGSVLGRMVIRLGKRFGFRTLCVVRREEQVEELRSLGADAVLTFDAATDSPSEFAARVRELTGGAGVAHAVDCVGGATGSAVIASLARNGRLLVFGTLSGEPLSFSPRDLMTPGGTVTGFWLGNYMESLKLPAKLGLVRTIAGLVRDGVLASEVAESFSLEDASAAVKHAEQPGHRGKVLLRIGDD